jgi:hypothetical protein
MDLHIKLSFGVPTYEMQGTTTICHLPVIPSEDLGMMPFISTAAASLKPEDTYDELIGKKVSLAKAESHAYRVVAAVLREELKTLRGLITGAEEFLTKAEQVCKHNFEYINKF